MGNLVFKKEVSAIRVYNGYFLTKNKEKGEEETAIHIFNDISNQRIMTLPLNEGLLGFIKALEDLYITSFPERAMLIKRERFEDVVKFDKKALAKASKIKHNSEKRTIKQLIDKCPQNLALSNVMLMGYSLNDISRHINGEKVCDINSELEQLKRRYREVRETIEEYFVKEE